MTWPFRKKKKPQTDLSELCRRMDAMAQGMACLLRDKKLEAPKVTEMWRSGLKQSLKANRCKQMSGSGDAYWNSVVDTVERHLFANIK